MVTPDVCSHTLTQIANKYCFNYDNAWKNSGRLRLQDYAHKHKTNQRKPVFFYIELLHLSPLTVELQHGLLQRLAFTFV